MNKTSPTQVPFRVLLGVVLVFIYQERPCSAEPLVSPTPPLAVEASPNSPRAALTEKQITTLIPTYVQNPAGWARDVVAAFHENRLLPSLTSVCMALAVIEQESSFQVNPIVPDLSDRLLQELHQLASSKLGPLGSLLLYGGLQVKVPGSRSTLAERLKTVQTERDIDQIYQGLLYSLRTTYPHLSALIVPLVEQAAGHLVEDFSLVTTIGPMQVSIRFAEAVATERGQDIRRVRDELYTRQGGVAYGVVRLLGYHASYSAPRYVFADFNAGRYASRNAALQQQVSWLTGTPLTADGDLLTYDAHGQPDEEDSKSLSVIFAFRQKYAPSLNEEQIRQDVRLEKSRALEQTKTYRAIKHTYEREFRTNATYARIPEVKLESVKLKNPKDNLWFTRSVEQKYQRCFQRYQIVSEKLSQVEMPPSDRLRNMAALPAPQQPTPLIRAAKTARVRPKLEAGIARNPTPKAVRRETAGTAREDADLTREEVARKIKQRLQQEGFAEVTVRGRGIVITLGGEVHSRREWQRVYAVAREEVNAGKYTLDQQVDIVRSQ